MGAHFDYACPPSGDLRKKLSDLANGGVHWWDYDKVPFLAAMILALQDRIEAAEKTVKHLCPDKSDGI